jgi:hypothetical protein
MGNAEEEWVVVERQQNWVVKRNQRGDEVETHLQGFMTRDEASLFLAESQPRTQFRYAVRLLDLQLSENRALCGQAYTVLTTTDRVAERWDSRRGCTEREVLQVLLDASYAVEELCEIHRPGFLLTERMIGFSKNNKLMVHCHSDFSRPEPEFEVRGGTESRAVLEHKLLENLLQVGQKALPKKVFSLQFCKAKDLPQYSFHGWRRMIRNFLSQRENSLQESIRAMSEICPRDNLSELSMGRELSRVKSTTSFAGGLQDIKQLQSFSYRREPDVYVDVEQQLNRIPIDLDVQPS